MRDEREQNMKAAKRPTAAQLDVMRKMAEGWRLYGGVVGVHVRYYVESSRSWTKIRVATPCARAMIGNGLIEAGERDGTRNYYRLTDAGREALEAEAASSGGAG